MVTFCGGDGTGRVQHVKNGDKRQLRWWFPGFDLTGAAVELVLGTTPQKRYEADVLDPVGEGGRGGMVGWFCDNVAEGIPVGSYQLEFEVTGLDGTFTHVPTEGFGTLIVEADLG